MKTHKELLASIVDEVESEDAVGEEAVWIAIHETIDAALDYIDVAKDEYAHYPVLAQVLTDLGRNIKQLSSGQ